MRSSCPKLERSLRGHKARGFTLTELMVTVAIIVAVLVVTVPSFTVIRRDLELTKARSDVFASLTAARSRAITSHNMVALHIFRDTGSVYPAGANYRWGVNFDPAGMPAYGLPHTPSNTMMMRLEVPNPDRVHNASTNPNNAIEFFWPADHDPVILPDSLGICRPQTPFGLATDTPPGEYVQTETARVKFADDFYIVFAEDGKLITVLADYNLDYNPASPTTNTVSTALVTQTGGAIAGMGAATWSASGLCLYDMPTYKAQPTPAAAYNYVNREDNTVTLSPYTGLLMEATR
jgi:prepilin-type N-terminal cleavage/methylation domain-containing protein